MELTIIPIVALALVIIIQMIEIAQLKSKLNLFLGDEPIELKTKILSNNTELIEIK